MIFRNFTFGFCGFVTLQETFRYSRIDFFVPLSIVRVGELKQTNLALFTCFLFEERFGCEPFLKSNQFKSSIFVINFVSQWDRINFQLVIMSYMLQHLHNGWQVDQAILAEEDRVVVIRFGHDWDPTCMKMDEVLYGIAEKVKNYAVIYLVDVTEVPDFNKMYELYDPCTVMFFFRNKHIMIDLGTGNNNKINWAFEDKQEMIDIVETVYRGARKGRGLVISPKDYSTKYRY